MDRIKVAHIITKLELGGAQENTLYTCGNLDKKKFNVFLIAGPGGILDKQTQNIRTYFVKELIREICPLWDAIAIFKIYKILKKEQPLIIHTHSSKAGILGRWAAYFYRLASGVANKIKIIHTFHGFGFHDFQNFLVKSVYVNVERITAKITDILIAVAHDNINKGLKNKIGKKEQYLVIRSGIKLQEYQRKTDTNALKKELGLGADQIVGMIACFKKQKSPLDFVYTARYVCDKKPETKFLLVGDGDLRPNIESLIKKLHLEQNVILTGWRSDVSQIIKILDVFILTSIFEGLPKVVVEAMASGVPVVATYVDGTKEIIQEGGTGFFVKPHENKKMAERILRLLNDAELRKSFSGQAIKYVNEFDIDLMVRQQEELYLKLLK
ncbi:MAG: putative glycosyltransferase EpsD [Elusimicrobia bacterium ADurb.Bin231]|nr:MAG: putative glycosyltransferase EpsD [Elusimicrobia bacterium ADurb.Bin231]